MTTTATYQPATYRTQRLDHQRILTELISPLDRAVVLTWNRPKGKGQYLVIERGAERVTPAPPAGYDVLAAMATGTWIAYHEMVTRVGVVVRRAGSAAAAQRIAHDLTVAAARKMVGAHYTVLRDDEVPVVESSAPYGTTAGSTSAL